MPVTTTGTLVGGKVFLQADITKTTGETPTYVTVACTTDVGYELSNDLIEKLCHSESSAGVDYVSGIVRWSVNVSGLLALDSALGGMDLRALVKAGTKFAIKVQFGGASGDFYEEGNVIVSNLSYQGVNKGGLVTWSATLQGTQVPAAGTTA